MRFAIRFIFKRNEGDVAIFVDRYNDGFELRVPRKKIEDASGDETTPIAVEAVMEYEW